MTQPTIEKLTHEEKIRIANAIDPMHADYKPGALNLTCAAQIIRDALTAQEVDGNRLPLDEVPEGYEFYSLKAYTDTVGQNYYSCTLRNLKTGGFVSPLAELFNTPAEALRAAIAAAKDGAG